MKVTDRPALLWLWRRPAATALIQPLAWEPPYATGAALKRQKKTKNKTKTSFCLEDLLISFALCCKPTSRRGSGTEYTFSKLNVQTGTLLRVIANAVNSYVGTTGINWDTWPSYFCGPAMTGARLFICLFSYLLSEMLPKKKYHV